MLKEIEPSSDEGFSLVENLITVLLVTFIIIGIASTFSVINASIVKSKNINSASILAHSILAQAEVTPWKELGYTEAEQNKLLTDECKDFKTEILPGTNIELTKEILNDSSFVLSTQRPTGKKQEKLDSGQEAIVCTWIRWENVDPTYIDINGIQQIGSSSSYGSKRITTVVSWKDLSGNKKQVKATTLRTAETYEVSAAKGGIE